MKQTHLLKLDAPYMIVWDEVKLRMCKHIATLIAISERKDETFSTEEYVVAEDGSVSGKSGRSGG